MSGIKDTAILVERKRHALSLANFHLLAASSVSTRKKWASFSKKTKQNIFLYFQYLRGLVEIHDRDNYANYNYWKKWFIRFVNAFDESSPYYDGNFEKVVLDNAALMGRLLNE